jgi:hypothetical protein
VILVCLGLFASGCGGDDDGATQEQLDAAKAEGAKEAREQAKLDQLQKQIRELQNQPKGDGNDSGNDAQDGGSGTIDTSGPVSTCDTGIQVGPNTSCAFAFNVAGEYGSNPGASTISAFSPVTGEYYTMSCGAFSGGGTVCTGGNGAAVYLP